SASPVAATSAGVRNARFVSDFAASSPTDGVHYSPRIGARGHRAGLQVSQNSLHVSDRELGRRFGVMAELLETVDGRSGNAAFDAHRRFRARLVEVRSGGNTDARRLDRLLNPHPEIENVQEYLELRLTDRFAARRSK